MKIQFYDSRPANFHASNRLKVHEGKTYQMGSIKGEALSVCQRVAKVTAALFATIFSFGFGLFIPTVSNLWKEGVSGYRLERAAVLIAARQNACPEQKVFYKNRPEALTNKPLPNLLQELKANYYVIFAATSRYGISEEEFLEETKDFNANGLPNVLLVLRFGEKAANITGIGQLSNPPPVLNLRFNTEGYIIDEQLKQDLASLKQKLS